MKNNSNDGKTWRKIVLATMLLVFVIIVFLRFAKENNKRISSQNERYVADATIQVADRINDTLESSQESIDLIADLFGQAMESEEVKTKTLRDMAKKAVLTI